jgi:nuclear pore complex protein Nup155
MALNMNPATPQRPTPGAFVNTPAPNRPGLFRNVSTQQQMAQQQTSVAPAAVVPSLTPIERAARTVNSMLDDDANYRDLETYLGREWLGLAAERHWEY